MKCFNRSNGGSFEVLRVLGMVPSLDRDGL
jgi:hypothetical protein